MRTSVRLRVTSLVVCAVLALTSGCTTAATTVAPTTSVARTARVELVNLSECDWRILVTTPDGREVASSLVPTHDMRRVEIAGGDYVITQTALTGLIGPETMRRFTARFEAGEDYRWRLATLLTGQTGATP